MFWFVACSVLITILVYKVLKYHRYWEEKGIPSEKSWPLFGELAPFVFRTASLSEIIWRIYQQLGTRRYSGIYQFFLPTLFVKDPDLIKELTIKNFDHFVDHRTVVSEEVDPISARSLLTLSGQEWHDMRATLSPAFTSSKMKFMFSLITACADQFMRHLSSGSGGGGTKEVEMKELFTRFSNDVIATCAFGLECDSMKNADNDFYRMVKDASDLTGLRGLKFFAYSLSPKLMSIFRVKLFPDEVPRFFTSIIRDTVKYREDHNVLRSDMVHLLMEARKGKLKHDYEDASVDAGFATAKESNPGRFTGHGKELTFDDMVSQAVIFVVAGFDTSSTLMTYVAYQMAINTDMQRRLQLEIDETREACGGKVTYDALAKMKYMDMVVSESLRIWPPFVLTDRKCVKDYTIEAKLPGETPIRLVKGNVVMVPIYGLHMDPKYFPEPGRFDPERFSDANRQKIVPGTYIPFGIGPRNCIGSRFALMESKAIIFELLSKFDVVPTEKTQIPIRVSKVHFAMAAEKGFWLGLKARS